MFEVGFQELVLIALLALIVLGPEKLPKLAAQLGRWTGRARSMARNLRQQLEQEVSYDDLVKQKQAAEEALRKAASAPTNFHHKVGEAIDTTLAEAEIEPVAQATDNDAKPAAHATESPADPVQKHTVSSSS
ncbi:MAG: Sec-independent protein translocase protein TatB [Steroidobacteraceae bacterium]